MRVARKSYSSSSSSSSSNLWWGEAPKRDRLPAYFSQQFVLSTREAAWPSRGWDSAIRLSFFISLRLDWFLPNTLQFKPKGQRETYPVCHIQLPARPCCINR